MNMSPPAMHPQHALPPRKTKRSLVWSSLLDRTVGTKRILQYKRCLLHLEIDFILNMPIHSCGILLIAPLKVSATSLHSGAACKPERLRFLHRGPFHVHDLSSFPHIDGIRGFAARVLMVQVKKEPARSSRRPWSASGRGVGGARRSFLPRGRAKFWHFRWFQLFKCILL